MCCSTTCKMHTHSPCTAVKLGSRKLSGHLQQCMSSMLYMLHDMQVSSFFVVLTEYMASMVLT